jgi:predicted peptidase
MVRLLCALAAVAALALPAEAKSRKAEKIKPGKVHALTTEKHGRAYSLFVPSKYSKKSSWPLVISSHGRGGEGAKEMRPWQGLANRFGFIVACPDMVTATNHRQKTSNLDAATEDDEVLLSIFDAVTSQFRVNRRAVMVTGFSGGGNPSYHSGLRHPDVFTHICTRGGNFAPQQIPSSEKIQEAGRKSLHIYIFFGDKDHELIIGPDGNNGQAHMARDALKKAGYENIEFERVDGMGHESRPQKAAEWFAAYVEENKKLFKAGDKVDGHLEKAADALEKKKYKAAIAELLKARKVEDKAGMTSVAQPRLDEINQLGSEMLAQAGVEREKDPAAALKVAASVARDFRGLPVAETAKGLIAEWKQ